MVSESGDESQRSLNYKELHEQRHQPLQLLGVNSPKPGRTGWHIRKTPLLSKIILKNLDYVLRVQPNMNIFRPQERALCLRLDSFSANCTQACSANIKGWSIHSSMFKMVIKHMDCKKSQFRRSTHEMVSETLRAKHCMQEICNTGTIRCAQHGRYHLHNSLLYEGKAIESFASKEGS